MAGSNMGHHQLGACAAERMREDAMEVIDGQTNESHANISSRRQQH